MMGVANQRSDGFDLLQIGPIRSLILWRGFPYVFQVLMFAVFVVLAAISWGQYAPAGVNAKLFAKTNLVTLLIWGIWWPAMIWTAVFFGRAWCAVCPMELVSNLSERLARYRRPSAMTLLCLSSCLFGYHPAAGTALAQTGSASPISISILDAKYEESLGASGLRASAAVVGGKAQPQTAQPDPAIPDKPRSTQEIRPAEPPGGLTAGWDKGFYVRSPDGNFEFRPTGILHFDFRGHEDERQINTGDTLASTFDIRRLRLGFEGFVFKDIGYTFEMNIDGNEAELIYAYLNFGHLPWANVRIGQFKEPFSYEVLYPEKFLDFVERSNIATSVAPAEDIGIMLHNLGNPYAGLFEYGLGVFNGEGNRLNNQANDDMEVAGRLAVLPFNKGPAWLRTAKVAANFTYSGEQHRDFDFRPRISEGFEFFPRLPVDGKRLRWGGDLQWYYGPTSVKAEYIQAEEGQRGEPDLITGGWHLDATWLITGEQKKLDMESGWELVGRYEEMRLDARRPFIVSGYADRAGNSVSVSDNRARSLTLGLNKYLNYNIKLQLNYQHSSFKNPLLTPTSRIGDRVLEPGDDSADKLFFRLQLFF